MKIVFSPKCLEYHAIGHPESPERVASAYELLRRKYEFAKPRDARENDLLLVHSKELVMQVKKGRFFDVDTPALPNIYSYAKISVGGAIKASQLALKHDYAFSLMRPPGHHAGKNFLGGFCYFNNIAVAVAKLIQEGKVARIGIVDIDAHHGNGTQDIFMHNDSVLYVSLHQAGIFPLSGMKHEANCKNFPLQPNTSERVYLKILDKALKHIVAFRPEMIAVSAGFDAYKKDPLTSLALEIESYEKIGKKLGALGLPLFAVLEGGYSHELCKCIHAFMRGLEDG